MKQLIVIIGPNAVGKSTAAKCMVEKIPQTAYVDSDWCRCMNPFLLTDITKEIVKENIYYLLHNYLTCVEIETVIFTYSWHGGRKEIYDRVIEQFRNDGIEFVENIIILKCSEEENVRRALEDKRDEERVERGKKTFSFYDDFDYPCIDTTEMSVTEVVESILRFVT